MRELTVNEVQEVNGGVVPIVVVAVIRVGIKVATNKKVQVAVIGAIGAVAGWFSE